MKIPLETLEQYKKDGWLKNQTHPTLPLTIWNYTPKTQYKQNWDEITTLCRGLVTDDEGNIVAHCLKKFFNWEELDNLGKVPTGEHTIYTKMDGSYIQIFSYRGEWITSSKGSFTSKQVFIVGDMKSITDHLDTSFNYIFELTGKCNRIVVDYPHQSKLTLLTKIGLNGIEYALNGYELIHLDTIRLWGDHIGDWGDFKKEISDDEEGYVILFESGERMKIKGSEYLRLHKIVTNTSSKDVWKALKEGRDLQELVDRTPDEWTQWVYKLIGELYVKRNNIEQQVARDWVTGMDRALYVAETESIVTLIKTRAEIAKYFITCENPALLFNKLGGKSNESILWGLVEPPYQKAS